MNAAKHGFGNLSRK